MSGRNSLVGEDFGAREPFAEELASNFSEKVLGDADTEHKKLVPKLQGIVGLSARSCEELPAGTKAFTQEEAREQLKRIVGWKLVEGEGGQPLRLRREWTLKDFKAGLELFSRIAKVAEKEGHHPDLHLEGWNKAAVEVSTHSIGGLSMNDFILAAKIEEVEFSDLVKKVRKFWA